ncbi:Guanine nucleotide exchange factor [Phaffia rhodozyma]|uniref:Guanine nucleotide exchange factor n=1 Tax=Phaffia rhodozyma TaxID=264483 RepID=A0A0F7SEI8_PHARH|nr:Guanine nucleotide exchange factor [Phaffia rhodozyma]
MTDSIPPEAISALLAASSSKARPGVRSFNQAGSSEESLVDPSTRTNLFAIYCPRDGCGCMLLRKGDAKWVIGQAGLYDESGPFLPPPLLSSSSHTSQTAYWEIDNSPFGFENAGFSRNIPDSIARSEAVQKALGSGAKKLKYLICADCDLGPLGWTLDGSKQAQLGVERVGYSLS